MVEILNEFKDRDEFKINIYSGDKDYICNWRGGEAWVHKALDDWYGHHYFNQEEYSPFEVPETCGFESNKAGETKAFNNLKFTRVYDAGHMVPTD